MSKIFSYIFVLGKFPSTHDRLCQVNCVKITWNTVIKPDKYYPNKIKNSIDT